MKSVRSLQTVLFTDVVGSTRHAVELGDRRWREVLADYHEMLNGEIARFGGREENLSGDGVLATFESPGAALRCAWSIHRRIRELDLEVRSGLHAGEVEGRGRELSGIVVHTAVRIADAAEPGEILASSTVCELVAGTGFGFEERGSHALHGVPGERPLFAVVELPGDPVAERTDRRLPYPTARQTKIGGTIAALALLVAFVLLARRSLFDEPGSGPAGDAASRAIAVLPFDVSGPELEDWREGMVTLLSTGLDGAGELRAIDNRTVLAQWDQRVDADARADRSTALEVARATGARYALLGSAVAVGPELRLVSNLYAVEDGSSLGSVQVEGSPDSVLALADELARGTLEALAREGAGELPRVDLASLTTRSLPALKAFLTGESAYRVGRLEEATEGFEEAVEIDTTFAMAWNRLASAYGWQTQIQAMRETRERALRHVDRLPERERILVFAEWAMVENVPSAVESAREATRRFPDDAEAWYLLGEFYYHNSATLATMDEAEAAFLRAVELDPTFVPYRYHNLDLAFKSPPDSALAARRVAEIQRESVDSRWVRASEVAFGLAFGDSTRRASVSESLPSLDSSVLGNVPFFLTHPRFVSLRERVLLELERRGISRSVSWVLLNLDRGRLEEALDHIEGTAGSSQGFWGCFLYSLRATGVPVAEDVLEDHLAPGSADSLSGRQTACRALYAYDRGRRVELDRAATSLRRRAERVHVEGDTLQARRFGALAGVLQGYDQWKRGDPAGAVPAFEEATRWMNWRLPLFWLGQIHLETGEPDRAVPYFRIRGLDPVWHYHLGVAYERSGEHTKAHDAYSFLVTHWDEPDPVLQPMVERAREGMNRTGSLRRE
ncbi:MAG: tetratricopeptide repeat protein [Gemmatimonadota bacterium]|nr:tetratricopeptide repeat protein [Gemmatimonadota bacterium]